MRARTFWFAVVLAAAWVPAQAQVIGEPLTPGQKQFCKEHPQECKEREARQKAWCKANPERCKREQARRAELRKRCASNKATCVKSQQGRNQRFEEFKRRCDANPADCQKKKAEARKYFEHRRKKCEADPVTCEKEREARRARMYNREKAAEDEIKSPAPSSADQATPPAPAHSTPYP